MAGANEAEQTPQEAEQAPRTPETATQGVAGTGSVQASQQAPAPTATAEAKTTNAAEPEASAGATEQPPQAPGFGERGRMRRRARFLRKARELAYRDLGGLVFDLHRFGQRNDQLVLAKLATLRQLDTELRELEGALGDHRPVTVLREVGIAACPRCAAIHGSDDRFCAGCGLAFGAHADRPISTAPVTQPTSTHAPATPTTPQAPAQPAPALKPTVTPAAAKPAASFGSQASYRPSPRPAPGPPAAPKPSPAPTSSPAPTDERKEQDRAQEDEPTQVLHPPSADA